MDRDSAKIVGAIRQTLHMTQKEFAWAMGCGRGARTVRNWETGETCPNVPRRQTMRLLLVAKGVTITPEMGEWFHPRRTRSNRIRALRRRRRAAVRRVEQRLRQ